MAPDGSRHSARSVTTPSRMSALIIFARIAATDEGSASSTDSPNSPTRDLYNALRASSGLVRVVTHYLHGLMTRHRYHDMALDTLVFSIALP